MSPSHIRQEEAPIQLACNQEPVYDIMSTFLKTPLEIRNQIYEFLLSTKHTKVVVLDEGPVSDGMIFRAHEWITLVLARINSYRQAARVPQQGAAAASIYTIVAQASEGLGLVEHAVGEMKEGMRHNSRDSRMATELVRQKNKIQSVEVKLEVLLAGLVVGVKHGAKQLRLVLHDHCSVSIMPSVVLSLPRDFGEWDDCQDLLLNMIPALITLLFFYLQFSLALNLRIGNVLPRLVKDVSFGIFSHSAYVDQKVHGTPRSFLNHEQWHQRNVVALTNASSVAYITLSTPTGFLSTMSLGSSLSFASASSNSSITASLISVLPSVSTSTNYSTTTSLALPSPSASATATQAPSLASLLGHTENLETQTLADWGDQTESACSTALIPLRGVATNPSGIAACYNIQSLNNSTGIFEVDLRLYRVAAPRNGWLKLNPSSVGVGLSYVNAVVSATRAKRAVRKDQTLPWFPAQRDEAADMYIRRSTGVPPRRLGMMTFAGTLADGLLAELKNMTTALSLLTPAITLSGTGQDGTSINTRLSTQDASFVNGVFSRAGLQGSQSTSGTDVNKFVMRGTKLVGFPIGLVISSIWAALYLMAMGHGTISRYQARESYRRRVKDRFGGDTITKRFSGDTITKRKMRWA
ncbi:MAG: hypothetical protein Q9175_003345 [Cornicularia normoerica]